MKQSETSHTPWLWVPSLYFAQGLPYVVVMTVAVIMFKKLGISNTDIALYTSWLYLPWVIKPFWSPLIDLIKTKRWWIVTMQIIIGAALAGIALTIPGPDAFRYSLAFMWLMAFSSATHDIAADGFYMLALDEHKQALFIGIRNTFYRLAVIFGQGLLVMFAGRLEKYYSVREKVDAIQQAWSVTFILLAVVFVLLFIFHHFILPRPASDKKIITDKQNTFLSAIREFGETFISFFEKKHIIAALAFILFYRFAESQLVKLASPFLLDPVDAGGLGLSTSEVGFIYGTVGVIALTLGGILGGVVLARFGLQRCLWWMTGAMNIPNLVYFYLAYIQPENTVLISACVTLEQFGYGFGFTSLTFFMMLFSAGKNPTAHYAICTGFMALGMMLPGMLSGFIQEAVGYKLFFLWIMLCTIPSFIATKFIHIEKQ